MDDDAFAAGTPEAEHEHHGSALLGGKVAKMGRAVLTNDRILFVDQKYNQGRAAATGGILAGIVADKLQKRHEAGGSERRLNDGFKKWDPLLRRVLAERHGRRVVEDGSDAWRAEA